MAIDSSLFAADIPAGAYAVGDVLQLGCIAGPANVRSGRGAAKLKQVITGALTQSSTVYWRIHVKNSDWVDDVQNIVTSIISATALDDYSGMVQFGNDCDLTINSGWQIYAECISAGTSAANSLFALIDIDYPSVSSIKDPDAVVGIPTSIQYDKSNVPVQAFGAMQSATWTVDNVDYFKAGYAYCLQCIEFLCSSVTCAGFVALSSAAGMGGLTRIIPICNNPSYIRARIRYASTLTKGPMDVKMMFFASSATTADVVMVHDFAKRQGA